MICGWRACGKEFTPRKHGQKYCRPQCSKQARHARRGDKRSKGQRAQDKSNRLLLLEQQRWICPWCELPVLSIEDASVDHIIPASHGGKRTLSNTQVLHRDCDNEKGDRCPGCPTCAPDGGRYREVA